MNVPLRYKPYEEIDDEWDEAEIISTHIGEVQELNELNNSDAKDELDDDDDDEVDVEDEYEQQFVNALNNFIKYHK